MMFDLEAQVGARSRPCSEVAISPQSLKEQHLAHLDQSSTRRSRSIPALHSRIAAYDVPCACWHVDRNQLEHNTRNLDEKKRQRTHSDNAPYSCPELHWCTDTYRSVNWLEINKTDPRLTIFGTTSGIRNGVTSAAKAMLEMAHKTNKPARLAVILARLSEKGEVAMADRSLPASPCDACAHADSRQTANRILQVKGYPFSSLSGQTMAMFDQNIAFLWKSNFDRNQSLFNLIYRNFARKAKTKKMRKKQRPSSFRKKNNVPLPVSRKNNVPISSTTSLIATRNRPWPSCDMISCEYQRRSFLFVPCACWHVKFLFVF